MSLTIGNAPFSTKHAGRFNFPQEELPDRVLYPHRTPMRVRVELGGETVAAGDAVVENAAWTHENLPDGAPPLEGLVAFEFIAMDAWDEEAERIRVHPRDPFHHVDVRKSTDHIRIRVDDVLVAETERAEVLFETGLPPGYYIPREDVRDDLLGKAPPPLATPTRAAHPTIP